MSVCAVMLVKDEGDMIGATVRHLLANVDQVVVSDNLSTDQTWDVLHEIKRDDDRLVIVTDEERGHFQSEKTTRLALEALDHGHRWVIPCDADEIWYSPDGRTLSDWFAGLSRETQFVKAAIFNHVASSLDDPDDPNPATRIRWKQRQPFEEKWWKVACRLRPDLVIHDGNHSARTRGTGTMGFGLELRHFPYRSPQHFVRKAINGYAALRATDRAEGVGAHWRAFGQAIEEGGEEAGYAWFYDAYYSSDPEADDSLVYDPAPLRHDP